MLGTIVNTLAIVGGSLLGLLFRSGIPSRSKQSIMQALALAVILIGLKGALQSDAVLVIVFSLAIGTLLGEMLDVEARLEALGRWFENRLSQAGNGIAKGFVTASLVYCVGSMAIVGSLESGLAGNHQTLFAKAVLDGISAIIFASTLGAGVVLSALPVFLYQGSITLTASVARQFLTPEVISQMSAVGGLLIVAIGFNLMEVKRLKVGNMLPAIFIPLAYLGVKQVWAMF